MRILGVEEKSDESGIQQPAFWQRAWSEVRHSRGEAIQAGLEEHEIVDEQLLELARQMLPEIRMNASTGSGFRLPTPAGCELHGNLLFLPVLGIEEGFTVPTSELEVVLELREADQWRE
jgi:hypothetical protein